MEVKNVDFTEKKHDCGCVEILDEGGKQVEFIPCDGCRAVLFDAGYVEEVLTDACC